MHCAGQICREAAPSCACLCAPCATAKTADGWPVCPICRRVHFGLGDNGYHHADGSVCKVTD